MSRDKEKLVDFIQGIGPASNATAAAVAMPDNRPAWRNKFHTVDELPDGDIEFLIENVLPKGVSFVGALSGVGKTWWCLSMARALSTGKPFLGISSVPSPVNVMYLCPEMNAKAFKRRLVRYGITERFFCQTISDGVPLDLSDELLKSAIEDLKPVLFLDTAIRFAGAEDENSSSQNAQGLAKVVFSLLHLGAQAVVCLHHRAKMTANNEVEMTLENVLRGTGDLGAMCDAVWGLQYDRGTGDPQYAKDSKQLVRLAVRCVKARDFRSPDDLRVQLEPFIDQVGDFGVLTDDSPEAGQYKSGKVDDALATNPDLTKEQLAKVIGISRNRVEKVAACKGWVYEKGKPWQKRLM